MSVHSELDAEMRGLTRIEGAPLSLTERTSRLLAVRRFLAVTK